MATVADVERAARAGADAVLIGTALSAADDPACERRERSRLSGGMTVEVKICGLTRPEDAAAAREAGADWLGVVFASGPRVVTPDRAAAVGRRRAGRPVLGVFGTQPVERILEICAAARLAGAQLHGRYTAADAAALRRAGLVVWRVVRLAGDADLGRLDERWERGRRAGRAAGLTRGREGPVARWRSRWRRRRGAGWARGGWCSAGGSRRRRWRRPWGSWRPMWWM